MALSPTSPFGRGKTEGRQPLTNTRVRRKRPAKTQITTSDRWLGPTKGPAQTPAVPGATADDLRATSAQSVQPTHAATLTDVGKVLVLNAGSSSIKFSITDDAGSALVAGTLDRIGEKGSELRLKAGGKTHVVRQDIANHGDGLALIVATLGDKGGVDLSEIGAVGHRVVHGGQRFSGPVVIDDEVEKAIDDNAALAPLHNPHNLRGIQEAKKLFGADIPQVAVFDTAFHSTMPPCSARYAVPSQWGKEIRRYGFHGLSVEHSVGRAAELLGVPANEANLIVCHLGNGASMTAVKDGKSFDTTMGFTPLEGLVMGTRGGVSDPGILLYLAEKKGMSTAEIAKGLNKQGGLLALSESSNDVRTLLEARANGDDKAAAALEKYCYEVAKQIGAYTAALSGDVDAVVFTGGVGENAGALRAEIMQRLVGLGYGLDAGKNDGAGKEDAEISSPGVMHRALVVHADEEGVIANQTFRLASEALVAKAPAAA